MMNTIIFFFQNQKKKNYMSIVVVLKIKKYKIMRSLKKLMIQNNIKKSFSYTYKYI